MGRKILRVAQTIPKQPTSTTVQEDQSSQYASKTWIEYLHPRTQSSRNKGLMGFITSKSQYSAETGTKRALQKQVADQSQHPSSISSKGAAEKWGTRTPPCEANTKRELPREVSLKAELSREAQRGNLGQEGTRAQAPKPEQLSSTHTHTHKADTQAF